MALIDLFRSAGPRLLPAVCTLSLVLGACAAPPSDGGAGQGRLSGTVTYLPRIALPPDAIVHVSLAEAAGADSVAAVLAEQTIRTEGRQVPIPFELAYDPDRIRTDQRYAVRAEIRDPGGNLLWTTGAPYPVLELDTPRDSVEIRVVQVTEPASPEEMAQLVGPEWRLVRIETPRDGAATPRNDEPYTITFGADGRYQGQAHCNRYGGEYRIEADGDLDLDRGLTSLAACPPPSVADAFFGVLNEVERFEITGGELRLDAGDDGALVFRRADGP